MRFLLFVAFVFAFFGAVFSRPQRPDNLQSASQVLIGQTALKSVEQIGAANQQSSVLDLAGFQGVLGTADTLKGLSAPLSVLSLGTQGASALG